jgi:catechol 2,3-dioxygenase-like lactoylglutathione lyase family enzyme
MLQELDHVTCRSTDLQRTLSFYEAVLGLRRGPRPPFGVPGAWLYAGARPALHVVERPIDGRDAAIDHVGFIARGRAAITAKLQAAGIHYELTALPDGSALQMFLLDPDGARLELVFKHREDR